MVESLVRTLADYDRVSCSITMTKANLTDEMESPQEA